MQNSDASCAHNQICLDIRYKLDKVTLSTAQWAVDPVLFEQYVQKCGNWSIGGKDQTKPQRKLQTVCCFSGFRGEQGGLVVNKKWVSYPPDQLKKI